MDMHTRVCPYQCMLRILHCTGYSLIILLLVLGTSFYPGTGIAFPTRCGHHKASPAMPSLYRRTFFFLLLAAIPEIYEAAKCNRRHGCDPSPPPPPPPSGGCCSSSSTSCNYLCESGCNPANDCWEQYGCNHLQCEWGTDECGDLNTCTSICGCAPGYVTQRFGTWVTGCVAAPVTDPVCGNGKVETGEECDPPGEGCSNCDVSTCLFSVVEPVCGDGVCDNGESCSSDCSMCDTSATALEYVGCCCDAADSKFNGPDHKQYCLLAGTSTKVSYDASNPAAMSCTRRRALPASNRDATTTLPIALVAAAAVLIAAVLAVVRRRGSASKRTATEGDQGAVLGTRSAAAEAAADAALPEDCLHTLRRRASAGSDTAAV